MNLARLAIVLLALCGLGEAAASQRLLFLATGNVPAGKFKVLEASARSAGMSVETRYLEKLPAQVGPELFDGFDAVFIDSYLQDYVRMRLERALPGAKQPLLWLTTAPPSWSGLPDGVAQRLVAYYGNGGRRNFNGFFALLERHFAGRDASDVPPPLVFPKAGIYHPAAPEQVFADAGAYFAWKGIGSPRPPTVGILFHQQYLASEQTGQIDDLVRRIEAAGGVAVAMYAPVMEPGGIARLAGTRDDPAIDVLINTQITLNADTRRVELEALGVPVIQAMAYRRGDAGAWAADPHGVAMMDVPFYFAQAEQAGITDIQVAAATDKSSESLAAIGPQAASMAAKALRLAALRHLPNAKKKLAVFFWNYPAGEKNLSASFLNLPRSLRSALTALAAEGYVTEVPEERALILLLQRLLAPFYRDGELESLLREGLAELFPVARYRVWLESLPAPRREEMLASWGPPERSGMVVRRQGQAYFVVPRLKLGNLVLMPQAPRGERWEDREKAIYHSTKHGPSHFYLAAYLWAREREDGAGFGADALVHFGTHGTQEWLPGKERGLAVDDYPMLAVGDLPVIYPYIVDDVGEAIQAKRRGRALTLSHQTPPLVPGGLHETLTRLHDLLHAYLAQDEGRVKDALRADLSAAVAKQRIDRDLGWGEAQIAARWPEFLDLLHAHLHELAETAQPLGLHSFGGAPATEHRLGTVLMMLGRKFWEASAAPGEEVDEAMVADHTRRQQTAPYRALLRHLVDGEALSVFPPAVQVLLPQAKTWFDALGAQGENAGLVAALQGRHIESSLGGDPIKNPEAYPTGRNLHGFDPSRLPTPQAWSAGKKALEELVAAQTQRGGKVPRKLAFALWSVETMRHQGLLEAQVLWALGVEPQWDSGGRVTGVRLVPREALARPRIDVVLSATGLYRDHFPNLMKHLAEAVRLAADAREADNAVAAHSAAVQAHLVGRGIPESEAQRAAVTRIFASETGRYGTGLDDAALATDTWKGKKEGDRKLAALYLARMQFAYGPDAKRWGEAGPEGINLYAEHLRGTEAAVLSRTSNLYGMLTTDDPFQYLGGIALAVRELDGKAPELFISNLRGAGAGRVEAAANFLAKELATRQFHPGYLKGLMAEGYAGTLEVLDALNNFWGWTAVAREIVRDDQWQEFVEVYVRDKHKLGLQRWFEANNPHAQAQMIERMLEAQRQGYWQTDAATVSELRARYAELARRFDVRSENPHIARFAGFGLAPAAPAASSASQTRASAPPPPPPPVSGLKLEPVARAQLPPHLPSLPLLAFLLLALLAGIFQGWREGRVGAEAWAWPRFSPLRLRSQPS